MEITYLSIGKNAKNGKICQNTRKRALPECIKHTPSGTHLMAWAIVLNLVISILADVNFKIC